MGLATRLWTYRSAFSAAGHRQSTFEDQCRARRWQSSSALVMRESWCGGGAKRERQGSAVSKVKIKMERETTRSPPESKQDSIRISKAGRYRRGPQTHRKLNTGNKGKSRTDRLHYGTLSRLQQASGLHEMRYSNSMSCGIRGRSHGRVGVNGPRTCMNAKHTKKEKTEDGLHT